MPVCNEQTLVASRLLSAISAVGIQSACALIIRIATYGYGWFSSVARSSHRAATARREASRCRRFANERVPVLRTDSRYCQLSVSIQSIPLKNQRSHPLSTLKPISAGQKAWLIESFQSRVCLLEGPLSISLNFRSRPRAALQAKDDRMAAPVLIPLKNSTAESA